jgi:hypothetical protein
MSDTPPPLTPPGDSPPPDPPSYPTPGPPAGDAYGRFPARDGVPSAGPGQPAYPPYPVPAPSPYGYYPGYAPALPPPTTTIGDLRVGDCFDQEATLHTGNETADVAEATVKPCSQPHQFEEYATFELDPGSYPGEDAISRIAEQRCFGMLRAYAGSPAKLREYSVYYFFPRPVDWKLRHDRLVQCLLGHDDGPTTGSLRRS